MPPPPARCRPAASQCLPRRLLLLGWAALLVVIVACQPSSKPPSPSVSESPDTSPTTVPAPAVSSRQSDQEVVSSTAPASEAISSGTPAAPLLDAVDATLEFLSSAEPQDADELRMEGSRLVDDLVERFPDQADAWEAKARLHFLLGELNLAEQSWQRALEIDAQYGYAMLGLGKIALLRHDYQRAAKVLEDALKSLPELNEAVYALAEARLKSGQVAEAIDILRDASQRDANAADTWLLLGQAYLAERQFEAARESFERAMELEPEQPRVLEGLGRTLLRMGERQRAVELLQAQQELRGEVLNRDAQEVFRDEQKEFAAHYLLAARLYLAAGQVNKAEQVLHKATVLDATNADAWTLLLTTYQQQGELDQAVAETERMCRENPRSASCFFTRGILLAQVGKVAESQQALEKVIRLTPQSFSGYDSLARLLIQSRRDLSRTVDLARKTVELRGIAADYELLAQAYAVNGRFDEAEQALSRAVELEPTNPAFVAAMESLRQFQASRDE